MTRDEFLAGFSKRLGNVLQKQQRAIGARVIGLGSIEAEAQRNLDAAVEELCQFTTDVLVGLEVVA